MEAEAEELEIEGWGKVREAITGSEVEGLYRLLRGVASSFCPLPSRPFPSQPRVSPSPPVSSQPPQESTKPEVSDPAGPATVPAPVAATSAIESDILADMQPLRIQLGAPKECTSARWKVAKRAHPPHVPPSAPMSGEYTWAWGWSALSAINLSSTQTLLGVTKKDTNFYKQRGREFYFFFFQNVWGNSLQSASQ